VNFAIAHLSDLHLVADAGKNPLVERVEKLAACCCQLPEKTEHLLLILTGDIAFSGRPEEYEIARTFLSRLRAFISRERPRLACDTILLPGNHDCDFDRENGIRRALVENPPADPDVSVLGALTEVQSAFRELAAQVEPNPTADSRVYQRFELGASPSPVQILAMNTAWLSQKHERQGTLRFPLKHLPTDLPPGALVIAAMHHPFGWLEAENAHELAARLGHICHLVLTGHEHDLDDYHKTNRAGEAVAFVEGGVLQSPKDANLSEFNLLLVDTTAASYSVTQCRWDPKTQIYTREEGNSTPLKPLSSANGFDFRDEFTQDLHDPGAAFTHPRRHPLCLRDLFVFPDFQENDLRNRSEAEAVIPGHRILDHIRKHRKLFIAGAEKAGKTALAKILVEEFGRHDDPVPLLICGAHCDSATESGILKTIETAFNRTYRQKFEQYRQLPAARRFLILDDYHRLALSAENRSKLLESLNDFFGTVVLLGSPDVRLNAIASAQADGNALLEFKHCEILELGHVRRAEMVHKWHTLGSDRGPNGNAIHRASRVVAGILGRDLIPSYPLFVLILLQQLEVGRKVETASGSFGYFCQVLITLSLESVRYLGADLDTRLNYLAELAFHLFANQTSGLSEDGMSEWHDNYCAAYKLRLDRTSLLEHLKAASLLDQRSGEWVFRYRHNFYYFVALYFAKHINELAIRERVSELAKHLHSDDAANILVLLTYLSRDPFIIGEMLDTARGLFSGRKSATLEADVEFLGNIDLKGGEVILEEPCVPEENRRRLATARDQIEKRQVALAQGGDARGDMELLNEALQANAAYKTVQILGQVLRNFPGSLKGEVKFSIASECYSLGLRVLSFFLDLIAENRGEICGIMADLLNARREEMTEKEREHWANRFVYGLMEFFACSVVRHVSDSVGSEKLSQTYAEILRRNDCPAYRLIDLSVKLDSQGSFPRSEALEVGKRVRKNLFAKAVLQRLVWLHFYVYEEDFALRQSVCEQLEIPVRRQLSSGKKRKGGGSYPSGEK